MNCNECAIPLVKKQSEITVTRPGFGPYVVRGVLHLACESCGNKLIFPDEAARIEKLGLRLHLIDVLKCKNNRNYLDLKEILRCDLDLLEEMIKELLKENIVHLNKESQIPTVTLIYSENKQNPLTKFLKKLFKKGV